MDSQCILQIIIIIMWLHRAKMKLALVYCRSSSDSSDPRYFRNQQPLGVVTLEGSLILGVVTFGEKKPFTNRACMSFFFRNLNELHKIKEEQHFVCIPHDIVQIVFYKKEITMINTDSNTVIKYHKSISTPMKKADKIRLSSFMF